MSKYIKISKKIYKNIKKEMKNKNISQKEVAKKMGISPTSIWRSLKKLSEGKPILTDTLFKIAYALDLEITELFK